MILGLRDPSDRYHAGETEADNLGQALCLVSLVLRILAELPRFEVTNATEICLHLLELRDRPAP